MAASRLWKLKGGSRQRRAPGGNDQTGKVFCHLWTLLCGGFGGRRKVALLWAHAVRLGPLGSKLKSGWKITTVHDRSTSLSTLLFTFLTKPGSCFTLKCEPANAICLQQLAGLDQGLIKTLTQGNGFPQTMGSIQVRRTPCLRYATYKMLHNKPTCRISQQHDLGRPQNQ